MSHNSHLLSSGQRPPPRTGPGVVEQAYTPALEAGPFGTCGFESRPQDHFYFSSFSGRLSRQKVLKAYPASPTGSLYISLLPIIARRRAFTRSPSVTFR